MLCSSDRLRSNGSSGISAAARISSRSRVAWAQASRYKERNTSWGWKSRELVSYLASALLAGKAYGASQVGTGLARGSRRLWEWRRTPACRHHVRGRSLPGGLLDRKQWDWPLAPSGSSLPATVATYLGPVTPLGGMRRYGERRRESFCRVARDRLLG